MSGVTRSDEARRLPPWQEWCVYLTSGLLAGTGLAWLAFDQWVRIEGEFGPEHHPAERWALIVHGALAYGFLVIAGTLVPVHVRQGWMARRNHKSGSLVGAVSIFLAGTGLLLYYAGAERLRSVAATAHWAAGIAACGLLAFHALRGRLTGRR